MALVTFSTPLPANGTATSNAQKVSRATSITGTVFTDQPGTVYVDQGGDGNNWDTTTAIPVAAVTGTAINVQLLTSYFQVRYINGNSPQTIFRLYVDPRDPYGAFLANSLPPSGGGQYAVLLFNQNNNQYQWVGRFDGADELGAISNAVNLMGIGGKYAAFNVADATVSDEAPVFTTDHTPASF